MTLPQAFLTLFCIGLAVGFSFGWMANDAVRKMQ